MVCNQTAGSYWWKSCSLRTYFCSPQRRNRQIIRGRRYSKTKTFRQTKERKSQNGRIRKRKSPNPNRRLPKCFEKVIKSGHESVCFYNKGSDPVVSAAAAPAKEEIVHFALLLGKSLCFFDALDKVRRFFHAKQ